MSRRLRLIALASAPPSPRFPTRLYTRAFLTAAIENGEVFRYNRSVSEKGKIIEGDRLEEVLREQVREVLQTRSIAASELTEFYIVSLLNDFHSTEKIARREIDAVFNEPLALLILQSTEGDAHRRIRRLRQIGDGSLMMVGFFSERIRRGILNTSYFTRMGGAAYASLAAVPGTHSDFSELYDELSVKFSEFASAISLMAPWNRGISDGEILNIYERWLATGDEGLKALLEARGL